MRFRNGERPPPAPDADDGLKRNESVGRPLNTGFSDSASPSQGALGRHRLRYLARRIHALGERPLYELLAELEAGLPFAERLEAYARLDGDFIRALGGHRLPVVRLATPPRGAP